MKTVLALACALALAAVLAPAHAAEAPAAAPSYPEDSVEELTDLYFAEHVSAQHLLGAVHGGGEGCSCSVQLARWWEQWWRGEGC